MPIAVLGFQVFIFASMFLASLIGRRTMMAVTVLWVLFTLFGSIYTMGLLAVQLITIYVSFRLCTKFLVWRAQRAPSGEPAAS